MSTPFVGPPQPSWPVDEALARSFRLDGAATPARDPYRDLTALASRFKEAKDECFEERTTYERLWWKLLLYTLGRQWIYWDSTRGQYADKRLQKWIPRPVTNKFIETVEAIHSVFQSVQLGVKCRPRGGETAAQMTADIADNLEAPLAEEHDIKSVFVFADFWLITLGNVFLHPWYDKRSETVDQVIPFEQCQGCGEVSSPEVLAQTGGACPRCGQRTWRPAMNPDGTPQGLPVLVGRGRTDVCSPFEVAVPSGFSQFRDITRLIRIRWRTKSWMQANVDPELVARLRFETTPLDRSLQMLRSLAIQTDPTMSAAGLFGAGGSVSEGVTEYELWEKPSKAYPEGLLLRTYGDQAEQILVDAQQGLPGPLPYHDEQGHPWFPWAHAGYRLVGGRIYAQSPLEAIFAKQDTLNQLDSLMLLGAQRMANPVWLEPKGAEVKKFTGEPGLVVRYNPLVAAGNAKPERIPGENIPVSLMNYRQQIIQDIDNLTGAGDVLKGQRPPNIEAFSALQLLVERSQSRFALVLANRGRLYQEWFAMALHLEREFGPQERIWTTMGPNRGWAIQHFQHADLKGGIDVLIEDGSQTPKTSLGNRAAIEQLNQLGFLDRSDPEQRYTVLKVFGRTDLVPSLDANVAEALREQDEFERWASSPDSAPVAPPIRPVGDPGAVGTVTGTPSSPAPEGGGLPPTAPGAPLSPTGVPFPALPTYATPPPLEVLYWQDDAVFNAEHRKWANSDNARRIFRARPDLKLVWQQHMMAHDASAVMKAAQQQMLQAGQRPGPPPSGAQLALERSNRESGDAMNVPRGQHEGAQGRGPE